MVTVAPPDTWTYALLLPRDPRAARVARMTARAVLGGHGRSEVSDVVELLVSELVTNVYLHTDGPASLRFAGLGDGRIRVGVRDRHPYIPAPFADPPGDRLKVAPLDGEGGRGLQLVQEYADWWGGLPLGRGAGKRLWFEIGGRSRAFGAG
ncbi:ATP-binding protein [Streptomyces antibioticus]|uniref:ATP-binding protein n=1 Tax=Streptomyces antibioticus TaxID=1890 RepID=UPI003D74022F